MINTMINMECLYTEVLNAMKTCLRYNRRLSLFVLILFFSFSAYSQNKYNGMVKVSKDIYVECLSRRR